MSNYQYRAGDPKDWIPKDQLEEGAFYLGKCRNSDTAQWKNGKFHYRRTKFGTSFMEELECPEDDLGYDCFFPQEKINDDLLHK